MRAGQALEVQGARWQEGSSQLSSHLPHLGEHAAWCRPCGSSGGSGDLRDRTACPERERDWQTAGGVRGAEGCGLSPTPGISEELLAHQPEPALDTVPQFPHASFAVLGAERGPFLILIYL